MNPMIGLLNALSEFRELDSDVTARTVSAFLLTAIEPEITVSDVAKRLAIPQSSASRAVLCLSKWEAFEKPGLDLVRAEADPRNRRRKLIVLTSKGELLKKVIRQAL